MQEPNRNLQKICRKLSSYIRKLSHFRLKQNTIATICSIRFLRSPLLPASRFAGFPNKHSGTNQRALSSFNGVSYISLKQLSSEPCDIHPTACEKFPQNILSAPTDCLHYDFTKAVHTPGHVLPFSPYPLEWISMGIQLSPT